MRNFLTDEEKAFLKRQHRKERDKRICDRIKAVLLYDEGWTLMQIAHALLLSDDAVRKHIRDYKTVKKLKPENGGSEEKLTSEQSNQLEMHLKDYTYLYVKDIIVYVKATWKVCYTVAGMRNWLRRHNFSYKKPALVPGKANKDQQEKWLSEYENLKRSLPKDETICFMDGVHPTHNVQLSYGWIKKGARKEVPTNTGRSLLNLSGMVDVISHKVIIQEDKTLNAESTIGLFQKIEKAYPSKSKIYLFCDNAPYYRNRLVRSHLNNSKIELRFLPPYSPNLNPIERLWKWMKERIIYNTHYPGFEEFKSAIFGFFKTISTLDPSSSLARSFRSRVRDKFRPIGSPITDS